MELAKSIEVSVEGKAAIQFLVPEEFAVGWHEHSAPLGVIGNTVLSGHHNAYGEVFKGLVDLEVGDTIINHQRGKTIQLYYCQQDDPA